MASVVFSRFFEIRLLHEYYLAQPDGTSIFDKKREKWDDTLTETILDGSYNILDDLVIEATLECQKKLNDYHIKVLQKPTGLVIGIEVLANTNPPTAKMIRDQPIDFHFLVKLRNPSFRAITNTPVKNTAYFFTNISPKFSPQKTFPFLTTPIAPFDKTKIYEMGQLAIKSSKLQLARKTNNSAADADWLPLSTQSGTYSYVNAQDSFQWKSKKFLYQLTGNPTVLHAKLINTSNKTQKKIDLSLPKNTQTVALDFSIDEKGNTIPDGLYKLVVQDNGGQEEEQLVFLSDTPAVTNLYALIAISTAPEDQYKLIDKVTDKGIVKANLVRTNGKHPVFDILFKSRATYWRYRSTLRKKLDNSANYSFLVENGPDLITKDPRIVSSGIATFQRTTTNSSTTIHLPSPDGSSLQKGDGIFYSDVFVSKL